eukprot:gene2276-2803_t
MTTHNEVGRRAFNFSNFQDYPQYYTYVSNNFAVFDAGLAFPDFGYDCGGLANESEAAHWPPFLRAGTEYLLKTYPQPWSDQGIKLAVFLLGIASHQVADISWHSIAGLQEGLIKAMSVQDFNGTYSIAHSNADEGGEFVLAYNFDLSWLEDRWYVPIKDMKNIFHSMNYTRVTEFKLIRCNSLLFAGAMGVKIGGRFLYPEIAKKSPFLVDHYQDYFNGGVDDMAIWTSYCWPVLIGWMEGDRIGNFCLIQPDPENGKQHSSNHTTHSGRFTEITKTIPFAETLSKSLSVEHDDYGGISIGLTQKAKELAKGYISEWEKKLSLPTKPPTTKEPRARISLKGNKVNIDGTPPPGLQSNYSSVYSTTPYSYFGRDILTADLNSDGYDDIIISSPGYGGLGTMQSGCVYYILNEPNSNTTAFFSDSVQLDIDQIFSGKICGNETHARFGWNIQTLDFNLDGILDLVIGAPSSTNADLTYLGKVYIYFGQIQSGKWSTTNPMQPDVVIQGVSFHDQAGTVIEKGDCNGDKLDDLILGTPTSMSNGSQRGLVSIYYSSVDRISGSIYNLLNDSDFHVMGTSDYEWFGYHIQVINTETLSLMLVGSPNYHSIQSPPNIGKITAYQFNSNKSLGLISEPPKFVLYGNNANDKVGYSFAVQNGSNFGLPSVNSILVFSLPTSSFSFDLDQVGQVLLVDIDEMEGVQFVSNLDPILQIKGETKYSRFGESLLVGKLSVDDEFPNLFVGAPLWTDSIDTGSGCVFSFPPNEHLEKKKMTVNKKDFKWYRRTAGSGTGINNNRKDSRFGFRMVLSDLNLDGKLDLIVGAGRDSSKVIEGGSINIFVS